MAKISRLLWKGAILAWVLPVSLALAEPVKCVPLAVSEYCFPGGDLADLVSVEQIIEQGLARAHDAIAQRSTPTQIPQAQQDEIAQMWRAAIARAYDYAQVHAHRLDSLTQPGPWDPRPLIRLTFDAAPDGSFRFDGQLLVNRARLMQLLQSAGQSGGDLLGASQMLVQMMLMSAPETKGYISIMPIVQNPLVSRILAPFVQAAAASDVTFMGALGIEMVAALSVAVEEALRAHTIAQAPKVHHYRDGLPLAESPQVLWNAHLLLSDEAIRQFSRDELELLMTHEAMHLMRPNFFLSLSAADHVQRRYFPQLNTERTSTILSNFLGRPSPGRPSNCPVEMAEDDELFIDYYVLQLYRDDPGRQRGYYELLQRIHRGFNPGRYSQAAFRVEFAEILMQDFADTAGMPADEARKNDLITRAVIAALVANLPRYLAGGPVRLEDILREMERYPEIAVDARLMRVAINYYRRKALLKDGWEGHGTASALSCAEIERLFSAAPRQRMQR